MACELMWQGNWHYNVYNKYVTQRRIDGRLPCQFFDNPQCKSTHEEVKQTKVNISNLHKASQKLMSLLAIS